LSELCYPQGRETHKRRVMLHFDNALVHNTSGFKRVWRIFSSEGWNIFLIVLI
jgi:hypothetical protein